MLKKLLTNKKKLILVIVMFLVLVGTLIAVITLNDSKEGGKSNVTIETDTDKDSDNIKDGVDEAYNGDGLEAQDTLDESTYVIDGSGDWNADPEDGGEKKQNNQIDNTTSDKTQSDNTQSDDTKKEETDNKVDNDNEKLDNDILVDDKVWGEIN